MKVVFSDMIQSMSGTINGVTYVTRNGKTFAYMREPKSSRTKAKPATPAERTIRDKFKAVTQQTTEVMHTTHLRAKYAAAWRKQKKYSTLRGFIFHCLYEV